MRKHHNKLYYGKYRYKTVFKMPGSLLFYPTNDAHLLHLKQRYQDAPDINFLADFIMDNRKHIKFRFQDRRAIFYANADVTKELTKRLWDYWVASENVDPRFNDLDANTVGCTRLPHGKYKYQVYIKKDAHLVLDEEAKKNLWHFLETNTDNCLVTNWALLDWFEDRCPYCFGGYFYVTEEQFITPLYMMAQKAIEKIVKYRKVKNGSNKKVTR